MKELSGALLFYFYVLCIFLLAVSAFWSVAFGAEVPTIKIDRVSQIALFNLYSNQYTVRISVAGGNGGARNYVGLYADNSATAPLLQWKYLDDTKDVTKTTRNLTAGTVTFTALTLPHYEVRFYNWRPRVPGNADELINRTAIAAPVYQIERRDLPGENVAVTRVPQGNLDEVRIIVANGNEERILMQRAVIFNNRAVTETPTPAFASQP